MGVILKEFILTIIVRNDINDLFDVHAWTYRYSKDCNLDYGFFIK